MVLLILLIYGGGTKNFWKHAYTIVDHPLNSCQILTLINDDELSKLLIPNFITVELEIEFWIVGVGWHCENCILLLPKYFVCNLEQANVNKYSQ